MKHKIQSIEINRLAAHPDNPNVMSKANFNKLVRNIKQTGLYEPLIVRLDIKVPGRFQILNGHHRFNALKQLDYEKCDCIIWQVDDSQADLLLSTLNRLCGNDNLDKKLTLLKKLNDKYQSKELAKLIPQTASQIDRLVGLKSSMQLPKPAEPDDMNIAYPFVFFLNDQQKTSVEKALLKVTPNKKAKTKAQRNADAICQISNSFLVSKALVIS